MAYNRTLKFYGIAFGSQAEITAQVDGVEVYSGPIHTLPYSDLQTANFFEVNQVMFSIENSAKFNTDFSGEITVTITVTSGDLVVFTNVLGNYWGTTPNPAFSPEQYAVLNDPASTGDQVVDVVIEAADPPFSAEEITVLRDFAKTYPTPSAVVNDLLQAHNVLYSVHSPDSWQECIDVAYDATNPYPWNIQGGQTKNCVMQIEAFN